MPTRKHNAAATGMVVDEVANNGRRRSGTKNLNAVPARGYGSAASAISTDEIAVDTGASCICELDTGERVAGNQILTRRRTVTDLRPVGAGAAIDLDTGKSVRIPRHAPRIGADVIANNLIAVAGYIDPFEPKRTNRETPHRYVASDDG